MYINDSLGLPGLWLFGTQSFSITTLKEGRFLDVNGAFERRYGYSREEVLGHTVHELKIWEDPADRVRMVAQLQNSGPIPNVITPLRTNSPEAKLTAYSTTRTQSTHPP